MLLRTKQKIMNLPLEKQTALVTGAGRGLGSEIARSFHREGAKVIINYRNSYELSLIHI